MTGVPERARVVVVGGGVIGCSVAYHLARLGWTDVVVLEQGTLSCGTTWHAAGLVGQLRASEAGTRLVQYSTDLYSRLEAETGLTTGYRVCGGLTVARTPERMVQLRRTAASAVAYDLECELLTPEQALERFPLIQVDDVLGAIWLPGDGRANPTDLTQSLAKGARLGGATIVERVRVTAVTTRAGRVAGVSTDQGDIEAEVVVNCAGQWAKAVGALAGVTVPLHSAEHFYVVTDQIEGSTATCPSCATRTATPTSRRRSAACWWEGSNRSPSPGCRPTRSPTPSSSPCSTRTGSTSRSSWTAQCTGSRRWRRRGSASSTTVPRASPPTTSSSWGRPGAARLLRGAGFNSVGIASAGGAGRALAEWVVEGAPTSDLIGVDLRRFSPLAGNNTWLRSRVGEVLGLHYAVPWPNRELESARPQRLSPVHDLLVAQGACLGSRNAWERANVFAPPGVSPSSTTPGSDRGWVDWWVAEQRATREAVAVFDQTSFSKYVVSGPDAERALQWLCTADVDVPVGRAVYTGDAQPAWHLRGRPHRDAARGHRVPRRQQRRDHGA